MGMMVTCHVRWVAMVSCSVVVVIRGYLGDNGLTLGLVVRSVCIVVVAATFYFGTCSHYYRNIFKIKLVLLDVYMGGYIYLNGFLRLYGRNLFSMKIIEK